MAPAGIILAGVCVLSALSVEGKESARETDNAAEIFCDRSVQEQAWDFFSHAHRGLSQLEAGVFILRDGNGSYVFALFGKGEPLRVTFQGEIPPETVAIFNAHPNARPLPSAADQNLARHVGLPVYVLTKWHVSRTDGTGFRSVWNGSWGDPRRHAAPRDSPCEATARNDH